MISFSHFLFGGVTFLLVDFVRLDNIVPSRLVTFVAGSALYVMLQHYVLIAWNRYFAVIYMKQYSSIFTRYTQSV